MKNKTDEFRSFVNVLEDCRIDKKIQQKYPGLKKDYLEELKIYDCTKSIHKSIYSCIKNSFNLHFKNWIIILILSRSKIKPKI